MRTINQIEALVNANRISEREAIEYIVDNYGDESDNFDKLPVKEEYCEVDCSGRYQNVSYGDYTCSGDIVDFGWWHHNFYKHAIVSELIAAGVLAKTSVGGVAVAPSTSIPGESGEEENDVEADAEPEDLFIGGHSNPLSAYFDGEPNADGSEDFEPENTDEPAVTEPVAANEPVANDSSMSDEDYDSFMKYTDLKQRLDAVKGNLIKIKRSRGAKAVGDISDEPSGDIERLATLKKSLEDKVNALVVTNTLAFSFKTSLIDSRIILRSCFTFIVFSSFRFISINIYLI